MEVIPTIRTSAKTRMIAKLTREAVEREPYATWADLFDAVKTAAARLKLACTPDDIREGVRLVASNSRVLEPLPTPQSAIPARPVMWTSFESLELLTEVRRKVMERHTR